LSDDALERTLYGAPPAEIDSMMHVDRILRDYADASAVNAQVGLWGFVDEHAFLTKAGHVGVVYRIRGQDTEALNAFERVWSTLVAGLKGESRNKSAARDQGVPRRLDSRSAALDERVSRRLRMSPGRHRAEHLRAPVRREFVRGPATTSDIPPHDSKLLDATRLFTKRG
jgi:hypothetical protein